MPEDTGALIEGRHGDPFALLGRHPVPGSSDVAFRCFLPGARAVSVIAAEPGESCPSLPLSRLGEEGFFAGLDIGGRMPSHYRLRVVQSHGPETTDAKENLEDIDDPYRFPPLIGSYDIHLIAEGSHLRPHEVLGARLATIEGVSGTRFAVWAPNARRISVVGDFNRWDGRHHPMRLRPEAGLWEIFLPGVGEGALYKFEILGHDGHLRLKADPCGRRTEPPPATASRIAGPDRFPWTDQAWMSRRASAQNRSAPIAVYEVHAGSWRRHGDGRPLDYRELADTLVPYVKDMGYTHIEFLPLMEHPFGGSWGYQPGGMFAPTSRFGDPDGLRSLVDRCHREGIGVLLDWVPGHFPGDEHGLARFDGTCLYEHEDERRGRHREWGTLIYNYGRREVANFLIGNALYWLESFHFDGLRLDAVASMLYLDYSREAGDWLPNIHGDNRNLEAVAFLRRLNTTLYREVDGIFTVAEESTSWPQVSHPVDGGGLGFGFKWNMGWMNDTLRYFGKDPVHRKHHHNDLTFGMLYAWSENFMLPFSHDEVVHGKASLLGKMPGDRWQQFANLRLCLAYLYAYPGKKLLFMGQDFGQSGEWDHDRALDWNSLDDPAHQGVHRLCRDLNHAYRRRPALHRKDCEPEGFAWIDCRDADQNVIAFLRRGGEDDPFMVVVANASPMIREGYRIGVPHGGRYREWINTDARDYGGSGVGNLGTVLAEAVPAHGFPFSLTLRLPPLAILILQPDEAETPTVPPRGGSGD